MNQHSRWPCYQPMMLLLIAISLGIVVDRTADIRWATWLALSLLALLPCCALRRMQDKNRTKSILLLLAFFSVGGLWHQLRWNYFGIEEVGLYSTDEFEPVALRAIVLEHPKRKDASPRKNPFDNFSHGIRSQLTIRVIEIRQGSHWKRICGNATLLVNGQVDFVSVGDEIEIQAKIIRSQRPSNPGEFDFYRFNRRQGKFCFVTANFPQSITVRDRNQLGPVHQWMSDLRQQLDQMIWKQIRPEQASIASAILLGNRHFLSDEQNHSFLVSGTIHILAISGLHVGILAGGLLFLGRLEILGRRKTYLIIIVIVLFYAWLVEFRPPVLRASILVSLYCAGRLVGRDGFSVNILSLAAILVLALNPADLFSAGAQLSFLAVASLSFSRQWLKIKLPADCLDRLIEKSQPFWKQLLKNLVRRLRQAIMMSLIIWLVAMPLVALRFNLVSPIGILVNPLLIIPLAVALYSGFATIILGWLFPPLGSVFGMVCDRSLASVQSIIEVSGSIPGSHFWTCGPHPVSVFIFYIGLLLGLAFRPTRLPGRWLLTLFVVWMACGWFLPNWIAQRVRPENNQIVATFIDVGHGTSILIEFADGQILLYDCGSFGSSSRGARHVTSTLWAKRIEHIDRIVISHADLDHFNALPRLSERFSIGCVYVSPVMYADQSPPVLELFRRLQDKKIKIKTIAIGDRWKINVDGQQVTVMGPPPAGTNDTDNSDSIILSVESKETRMLLTGDLEGAGLQRLLQTDPGRFEIVLAPHHGSKNSRPGEFMEWARPELVVISGDSGLVDSDGILAFRANGIDVLRTEDCGAIEIKFGDGAEIQQRTYSSPSNGFRFRQK